MPARRRRRGSGVLPPSPFENQDHEPEVAVNVTGLGQISHANRADVSRQKGIDRNFRAEQYYESALPTPHRLQKLHTVFTQSTVLRQCVDAYCVNINCFGLEVVPVSDEVPVRPEERRLLERWIERTSPTESLAGLRNKVVFEYEKYGFSFIEVIRNRRGDPTLMQHAKASITRMMRKGPEVIPVTVTIRRGRRPVRIRERKRFRRYIQWEDGAPTKTYFKEFGDPRRMSYSTGRYEGEESNGEIYRVADADLATEILHIGQISEESYGEPRWIGHLPSLLGSREAEEVNLRYFEDNTVPPAILSIAGGKLTRASFQTLQDQLTAQGIGKQRQHQILLIEAVPKTDGLEDRGNVTVKLDKLTDARQSDALFKGYDDSTRYKLISCFRIAPILIGDTSESNYANAQIALSIAETQVFYPERKTHDEFLNANFINHPRGLNLKTVRLETRGPVMTTPEHVVRTLTALNVMGGLTPRTSVDAINQLLDMAIPPMPEPGSPDYYPWMDQPIQLVLKNARSDNTQDEQGGKSDELKDVEETGNVVRIPENSEKGSGNLPSFNSGSGQGS